jgi:hypothetical protein
VGNNIVPGKVFAITDLHPGSSYKLRVTAYNAAGSNTVNYLFTTLTATGGEFVQVKINKYKIYSNLTTQYHQAHAVKCHTLHVPLTSL